MAWGLKHQKGFVIGTCLTSMVFMAVHLHYQSGSTAMFPFKSFSNKEQKPVSSMCGESLPEPPPYAVDYIPEQVALQLPACQDYKQAADLNRSEIRFQGDHAKEYRIGDTISVLIKLFNAYGNPLQKGGALLRARMFSETKNAFARSTITDHGNGSYTALFEALWTGKSTIKVKLPYTPETIRAMYYTRIKLRSMRDILAVFSNGKTNEETLCHPSWQALRDSNYSKICNLTGLNSGMPWYCGKPRSVYLLCEDWTAIKRLYPLPELPYTHCETLLLKRANDEINQTLSVAVAGETIGNATSTIPPPTIPCRNFNVSSLWMRTQPTGFLYDNKWHLRHCKDLDQGQWSSCLKNRRIMLFGDSTVRQWYIYVMMHWNCVHITEPWTQKGDQSNMGQQKWHKRAECVNRENNFTVQFLPHSMPFFGKDDLKSYMTTSIAQHLEEVGNEEQVVALVHIFLHSAGYHNSFFRQKILNIRRSVERLIDRNKFAKVFVKGPHTYNLILNEPHDYIGLVYRHIMYDAFAGLHGKVVYLDNSDITNSKPVENVHPPYGMVGAMLDQMLAYLC